MSGEVLSPPRVGQRRLTARLIDVRLPMRETNMLIRLIFILCTSALVGCASSSKTFDADGKEAHVLNCSGTARNWGMCLEKAGEICGTKGYEIVQKSGDTGWIASGSNIRVYGRINDLSQYDNSV